MKIWTNSWKKRGSVTKTHHRGGFFRMFQTVLSASVFPNLHVSHMSQCHKIVQYVCMEDQQEITGQTRGQEESAFCLFCYNKSNNKEKKGKKKKKIGMGEQKHKTAKKKKHLSKLKNNNYNNK